MRNSQKVWDNAKDKDGRFFDPYTGGELFWDKSKSSQSQWNVGHIAGHSYDQLKKDLIDHKTTYHQFLDEYNAPKNYIPQSMNGNRSRRYD